MAAELRGHAITQCKPHLRQPDGPANLGGALPRRSAAAAAELVVRELCEWAWSRRNLSACDLGGRPEPAPGQPDRSGLRPVVVRQLDEAQVRS